METSLHWDRCVFMIRYSFDTMVTRQKQQAAGVPLSRYIKMVEFIVSTLLSTVLTRMAANVVFREVISLWLLVMTLYMCAQLMTVTPFTSLMHDFIRWYIF